MRPSTLDYLRHILDEATYLLTATDQIDESTFLGDETLKRACVGSIEIIGEATKQIAPELRNKYTQVEWRAMSGMRDVLVHDYFGVDYQIVWDVVRTKIPQLQTEVQKILNQETPASR